MRNNNNDSQYYNSWLDIASGVSSKATNQAKPNDIPDSSDAESDKRENLDESKSNYKRVGKKDKKCPVAPFLETLELIERLF